MLFLNFFLKNSQFFVGKNVDGIALNVSCILLFHENAEYQTSTHN